MLNSLTNFFIQDERSAARKRKREENGAKMYSMNSILQVTDVQSTPSLTLRTKTKQKIKRAVFMLCPTPQIFAKATATSKCNDGRIRRITYGQKAVVKSIRQVDVIKKHRCIRVLGFEPNIAAFECWDSNQTLIVEN